MQWQEQLNADTLTWLLEHDNPGVRFLALRDLLEPPADDSELLAAQELAHREGPISVILNEMDEAGFWVKPGPGYYPKYRGTVWALILLGQLGASVDLDPRIARACSYLLDQALTANGQFTISGTPSTTVDCLQGNLISAMLDVGFKDPRLDQAFEWMARTTTADGIAPITICGGSASRVLASLAGLSPLTAGHRQRQSRRWQRHHQC